MAFSIVLAVFAVAVCIFGYCNTARSANTLIVSAENIDRLLSDGEAEKALEESRKLQADWEKIHDKLCVFLPHEHLEPLENIFAVLPYYICLLYTSAASTHRRIRRQNGDSECPSL